MGAIGSEFYYETLRFLKDLLQTGYLYPDARSDVEFMLRLHKSKEYCLDRYSPIVLIYPFLVNPKSPAGMVLRSLLQGYTGDLFQRLASEDYGYWWGDEELDESALPYPFEQGAVERAAGYLEEPLHSGDLLNALLAYPMDPHLAPLDAEKDWLIYDYLRQREPLPQGLITFAHSEIASFLEERGIHLSTLVMRLRGYAHPDYDPDNVAARYSLAIGLHKAGRLKVCIIERWGKHNLTESEGLVPAPHGLWLPESVLFLPNEIEEFEALLNAMPPVPEEAFQEFFEMHPKWLFLLGEQYEDARPQIRLPPLQIQPELALGTAPVDEIWLKPDFLLKRIALNLWDVLDIKASDRRVVVGRQARRKFSEAVADAVAQLREYSRRLHQNEIRAYLKREHGLTISEPIALILVGRDFDFKTFQEKSMLRSSEGVRIYTYDDLYRLAKHRMLAL